MNPSPRFRRPPSVCGLVGLLALVCAPPLFSFQPNEWRQLQTLSVPAPGLVRINLPAATLNAAQPSLEDLRIVDAAGNQVPYLIERPASVPESTLRPKEFHSTIRPGATQLILETGTSAPIVGVSLETPASYFIKAVDVEESHDRTNWKKTCGGSANFSLFGWCGKTAGLIPGRNA
jgi:hypothetical protein